jgi:hypothetical protein
LGVTEGQEASHGVWIGKSEWEGKDEIQGWVVVKIMEGWIELQPLCSNGRFLAEV